MYDIGLFGFALPIDIYIWGRGLGKFANYALRPELPPIIQLQGDAGRCSTAGEPLSGPVESLIEVEAVTEPDDGVMH